MGLYVTSTINRKWMVGYWKNIDIKTKQMNEWTNERISAYTIVLLSTIEILNVVPAQLIEICCKTCDLYFSNMEKMICFQDIKQRPLILV